MTPNEIATHRIAAALEQIAEAIRTLDLNDKVGRDTAANLGNWIPTLGDAEKLEWTALSVRSCAPFTPVSEAAKQDLWEEAIDTLFNMRVEEYVEDLLPQTEWEWRAAADEKVDNLRYDAEHETDLEVAQEFWQQIADFEALTDKE